MIKIDSMSEMEVQIDGSLTVHPAREGIYFSKAVREVEVKVRNWVIGSYKDGVGRGLSTAGSYRAKEGEVQIDKDRHKTYISYMGSSATLSIRVPLPTRRWLERFAKRRGSAGMAATRILEEARRRENFPAVEFRDTPLGRVAYVQGTRVQVAFVYGQKQHGTKLTPEGLAESFSWPLWKATSALAYIQEFSAECQQEWEDLGSVDAKALKSILPQLLRGNTVVR